MRNFILLFLIAINVSAQNLVITNVSLVPVSTNTVIVNMNVYITNGIIDKIVPGGTKLPFKDYKTIEGKGKFLMPGMYDMHGHLPDKNSVINLNDYLKLQLAAGVTSVRSMRGDENQLKLRDSIAAHKKTGPELHVSFVFPDTDSLLTKDKIDAIVFDAKIKKFDFVKYLGGLNPKHIENLSAACYSYKIPLAGHAYNKSLDESLNNDFASIEHFQSVLEAYGNDPSAFDNIIARLKQKNTAICPTLSFYRIFSFSYNEAELNDRNGMNIVSDKVKTAWQKEYNQAFISTKEQLKEEFENKYTGVYKKRFEDFNKVLKQLADNKVLLLLSPDDGAYNVPGFSMVEEMKLYKQAGLDNYQILKCATLNAAQFLGHDKTAGTVEQGKRADLILLNANPLDNIENVKQIEGIVLNGEYYSQNQLLGITVKK